MKKLIVIAGPTASGKTSLSLQLAELYNTSILSCDSRQCYKEMSIGVAKPSAEEINNVPHYFINSHSIHDEVSAGVYERYALESLAKIFDKNDIAICVGGTGLYLKALCEGIDEMPAINPEIENEINSLYELHGLAWLQHELYIADPAFYNSIDTENPRRLLRGLTFFKTHQKSILSYQIHQKKTRPFDIEIYAIETEREKLYQRINNRVDKMMSDGLLAEATSLHAWQHLKSLQTVGYTELFQYLHNNCTLPFAIDKIKQHTRNYAKRQITWFKNQANVEWVNLDNAIDIIQKKTL